MCEGIECDEWRPQRGDRVYFPDWPDLTTSATVRRAARDGTWVDVEFSSSAHGGGASRWWTPKTGMTLNVVHLRARGPST